MNTSRRNNTIKQINSWAILAYNYVANSNYDRSLSNLITEIAHLMSKLCR